MAERAKNNIQVNFKTKPIDGGYVVTVGNKFDLIVVAAESELEAKRIGENNRFGGPTPIVLIPVDGRILLLSPYGIELNDPDIREETNIIATIELERSIVNLRLLRNRDVHDSHTPRSEFIVPLARRIFVAYENERLEIPVPSFLKTTAPHSFLTNGIGISFQIQDRISDTNNTL